MENNHTITISIDTDVAEKFSMALSLNKEKADTILQQMMMRYISESFSKVSREFAGTKQSVSGYPYDLDENFGKANRKIALWAQKPNQNNHRIIKAYLELEEEAGHVTVDMLADRCGDSQGHPDTFINDFRGNFAQMKTDAGNSHGKVFVVNGFEISIWEEVLDTVMDHKVSFLGEGSGNYYHSSPYESLGKSKITDEMTEAAYIIAKKVYQNELSRTDGKFEIEKLSGMNPGSAQDYITIFLDMMQGKPYHRTSSNYCTEYFLENILKDFGQAFFVKAISATEKHIDYYNSLGYGQLKAKAELIERIKNKHGLQ